ncbi:glyoxalase-like protein [Streptomyces sp. 2333.5]|uniref:VOC family protein n=1 Tax=unclassified Streptomyces TaxID=2593676 RepID=UPI000897C128|nr:MULTISPECIES: VOC family protein [unclassified Streptomyces]PJJ05985.1 glyoxalase-like protein [Streptomyces sp. 2333.5]SEE88157.1 Glyoxalase-like domain-containing protein [Streptomyces sp. 2314.4]SEF05740.1 Glyoxalase-like domain-containing protein [Streptomyces sp. 2112.2]
MLSCSHVLCKVDDIRSAVRDYQELGFTVEWGSAPERAHNALLWFERGPFIEFFQLPPAFRLLKWPMSAVNGVAAGDRLARWARPGEGWRDLALETDTTALHGAHRALRTSGSRVSRVMKGRRTRPDGDRVGYQFLATRPARLPFVVSAYDPPQRPTAVRHPNGATHIRTVRLGIADHDRPAFDALAGHLSEEGPLRVEQAPHTGVIDVELAGVDERLDRQKLHGAVFSAAVARKE